MALPYELLIGLRYTRAKRRNHFISFISLISMLGIGLGVAALIVVLSVMNGFQKELRTRILGVASHIQITGINGELSDWRAIAAQAARHPEVRAAAPFVQSQAMFTVDGGVKGALVRGILPDEEERVADFRKTIKSGSLDDLRPGEFGVVLGADRSVFEAHLRRGAYPGGLRMFAEATVIADHRTENADDDGEDAGGRDDLPRSKLDPRVLLADFPRCAEDAEARHEGDVIRLARSMNQQ
jgi:hypothetical protein